jgi:hypothetical protein
LVLRQASNELPNFVAVRSLGIAPEGRTGAQDERILPVRGEPFGGVYPEPGRRAQDRPVEPRRLVIG